MLEVIDHGPVREIRMTSLAGRVLGYKVSAFVHDGVLIDTGFPRAERWLGAHLDARSVRGAILTHWHEDHSGNLALLVERGLQVAVRPRTLQLLPRTHALPRYRQLVWGAARPVTKVPEPVDHRFELVPTPGHTEDHVAVWDPAGRIVFLGDLFLGVRACLMHPGEDPYALLDSVERVIALGPKEAFCAHRGRLHDPVATLSARARWLDRAIREVERLVDNDWEDGAAAFLALGTDRYVRAFTGGELSKRHFVAGVRAELARGAPPGGDRDGGTDRPDV